MNTIPRDWIERYADQLGLADYEVIAQMLVLHDAETAMARAEMDKTIEAKVGKLRAVNMDNGYFTASADVWRMYNRGRISMSERDKALNALRCGIPAPIRPLAAKTPRQPTNLEDLA